VVQRGVDETRKDAFLEAPTCMKIPFHRKKKPETAAKPSTRPVTVETQEMVKFALDPEAKKRAESIYRRFFTEHFAYPLAAHGFKRHGGTKLARVTDEALFQFFSFQKSAWMNKSFKVSVALRPLYIPNDHLTLRPGQSLGGLAGGAHDWWEYWTEEQASANFPQIRDLIERFAVPWFDRLQTTEDLLHAWNQGDKTVVGNRGHWRIRDHAFMLLRIGRLEEARGEFEQARRQFREDGRDWALRAEEECGIHLSVIEGGEEAVTRHLRGIETTMREKWKLVGW
jgi:hypothetical protein